MVRLLGAFALMGFSFFVAAREDAYAQAVNGIQTQGTLSLPEVQLSPFSAIQLAPGQQRLPPLDHPRAVHDVLPYTGGYSPSQLSLQAASGSTIPLWQGSAVYQGQTYSYQMVGQNPTIKLANPSTAIQAIIVPLVFTFPPGNSVFDPTVRDPTCSRSGSPVAMTWYSPVFQAIQESPGGKNVGTGQYASLFQRANFWNYVQPTGINPNYTVSLKPVVGQIIYVKWPNATLYKTPCGTLAAIDRSVWESALRSQVFQLLVQSGVGPTTLPIFLTYNVVFYDPPIGNTFVTGYHSAAPNSSYAGALQTYVVAEYDSSNAFSSQRDIHTLSHEIGEWMDNPVGNNVTPKWGHVGQVPGCQATLEVGDPLTGTTVPILMPNSFTYHVQDLAFLSWFYRQAPSIAINGWYSFFGTFKSSAGAPCVQ